MGLIKLFILLYVINQSLSQEVLKISFLLLPEEFHEKQKGQILCITLIDSHAIFKFSWLKNGLPYPFENSTDVRQVDETTTSRLVFDSLDSSHSGNYMCIVENSKGSARNAITVNVKVSPRWITEPDDVIIEEDEKVILPCTADGYPKPIIKWSKKEGDSSHYTPIDNIPYAHVDINNSLIITPTLKSHAGFYTCEAASGYGNDLTKTVQLIVSIPPKLQQRYNSKTVKSGSRIDLPCQVSGDQPLYVKWKKDNEDIIHHKDKYSRYQIKEDTKQTSIMSTLSIKDIRKSDEGVFYCLVSNSFGSDQLQIKINVLERPSHPVNVIVNKVWSRSVKISWETSSDSNNKPLQFIVEYWSISDPESVHENTTVPGLVTSCIIKELQPASTYRTQVWAENDVGISQPSEQVFFITGNEEPSAPPRDSHLQEVGATYAHISWRPPPNKLWNGELLGFFVGYRIASSDSVFSYYTIPLKGDVHSFILRGLRKYTRYSVIVKAYNSVGLGPPTEELLFRTKEEDPPPPPVLFIENWNSLSVDLHWTFPVEETQVSGFTISYRKEGYQWKEIPILISSQRKFTLTDLEPDQLYHVFIVANSNFGNSEPSEVATVRTTSTGLHQLSEKKDNKSEKNKDEEEVTKLMYIVIPVCSAVVVIVIVIAAACLYVYSKKRPIPPVTPYMPCSKDSFVYTPSMTPRYTQNMLNTHHSDHPFKGSPYSTMPLTAFDKEEEPIYESVMDEMRNTIKKKEKELELKAEKV